MNKEVYWKNMALLFWYKDLEHRVKGYREIFKELFINLVGKDVKKVLLDNETNSYIAEQFPVIELKMKERLEVLGNFIVTVNYDFYNDRGRLEKFFGINSELTAVKVLNSDSHNEGHVNLVFIFEQRKVIYKNRDMSMDVAWNLFSSKLFESIAYRWKIPKTLNRKRYGWQEFVEFISCKTMNEVKQYYENFGALSCVAYLLCGVDFHKENIITHGKYPCVVDTETFIHNSEFLDIDTKYKETVLETAFFPSKEGRFDISSFSGNNSENIPIYRGYKVKPIEHIDSVFSGFWGMYNIILNDKEWIRKTIFNSFRSVKTRIIVRNTYLYAKIIEYLHTKISMKSEECYVIKRNYYRNYLFSKINNHFLVECEMKAIEQLDIPYFFMNIYDKRIVCEGIKIVMYANDSPAECLKKRINKFSRDDLIKNIELIYQCIKYIDI